MTTRSLQVVPKGGVVKASKLAIFVEQFGLSPAQREDVVFMITEYRTHLPAIERVLGWGLNFGQMRELFDAREALSSQEENASLHMLHKFVQAFPAVGYDTTIIVDKIVEIRDVYDPLRRRYVGSLLSRLVRANDSMSFDDPVSLAEVLAMREGVYDGSES